MAVVLSITLGFAQTFVGSIRSTADQEAVPYACVIACHQSDGKLIVGALSKDDGSFSLTVPATEHFYIEVRYMGYKSKKITDVKNTDLGMILLESATQKLSEVVVSGQRKLVRQKTDRLVFDINRSPMASIGDAVEALNVTPGLNVQNNSIAIIGKQTVMVMINDRIVKMTGADLLNYLHTIPAQNILQIEVITTPPARYDAEGNSGLINIRLKASDNDSWSNQLRSTFRQGMYATWGLGNTFAYNQGKVSLLGSLNADKGYRGQKVNSEIDYPEETWMNRMNMKSKTDNIATHIGFDYRLSPKSAFGFFYSGSWSNHDETDSFLSNIYHSQTDKTQLGKVLSNGTNDQDGHVHSANAHYTRSLNDRGFKLSADVDYFNYKNGQNRHINSITQRDITHVFDSQNIGMQDVNNISVKIDFDQPIQKGMITYGAKWINTQTNNKAGLYRLVGGKSIMDPNQSNTFDYTENIGALYFDVAKAVDDKWSFKGGLRMEYTQTIGYTAQYNQEDRNDDRKFFPTVYLTYTPNQKNVFNLNYSRRISRPGFWSLNPFKFYLNATTYQEGTPDLKPEISDNIELQHIYKGCLITKLYGIIFSDGFGNIPFVDKADKMLVGKSANFWDGYAIGLNETYLYNPTQWWNTVSTAAVYKMDGHLKKELHLDMKPLVG